MLFTTPIHLTNHLHNYEIPRTMNTYPLSLNSSAMSAILSLVPDRQIVTSVVVGLVVGGAGAFWYMVGTQGVISSVVSVICCLC